MTERKSDPADITALPGIYSDGINAMTAAYQLGVEEGRRLGREEQAREHHQWLLGHDETLAQVAEEARQFALLDAAKDWDASDRDELKRLAEQHYVPGGPSMPTIWLRLRAEQPTRESVGTR